MVAPMVEKYLPRMTRKGKKTKKEILPFATTWMSLEDIMLSEISQTEKDILYVITYMWNLKNKTNEYIYNKTETDSQI